MRQGVPFSFSFTCHVQFKTKTKNTTTQMGNCVEALIQDFTNNGLLCSSFNYIHPSSTISLVWITGESISAEMPRLFSPQPPPSALPCRNRVLGLHWGLQPPPPVGNAQNT